MKFRISVLALALATYCFPTFAGWVPPHGPPNGWVVALAVNGDKLFASSYSGVYVSSDAGVNWTLIFTPPPNRYGAAIAYCFAFSPNGIGGTDIFVGTNTPGVYRSTDNGATWTGPGTGLVDPQGAYFMVKCLAFSGTRLFAGTTGTYGSGIFLSPDNGETWGEANTGLTNKNVQALLVSGTDIYAGTDGGVFLSSDNGISWGAVNAGLEGPGSMPYITSLAFIGPNIFAGANSGVYRSATSNISWTLVSADIAGPYGLAGQISSLAVGSSTLFAGTWWGGVFLSENNGDSWVSTAFADTVVYVLAANSSNLFAGTPSGVWVYTPEINTTAGQNVSVEPVDVSSGTSPVSVTFDEVLVSGYTSLTLSGAGSAPPSGFQLGEPPIFYEISTTAQFSGQISVCITYPDSAFLSPSSLVLLHFEGGTWVDTKATVDAANNTICCVVSSLSPFVIVEPIPMIVKLDIKPETFPNQINLKGQGLIPVAILTTNAFDARKVDPLSVRFGPKGAREAHGKGHLEDANGDGKKDMVLHFNTQETGIQCGATQTSFVGLTVGGRSITGSDAVVTIGCGLSKDAISEEIPPTWLLEQNYPNPFNPSTTIRYGLPTKSTVLLAVFNALGQRVATLVDGERETGYYDVGFDGSGLSSGVYLYRLQADNFVVTRKLLLVK